MPIANPIRKPDVDDFATLVNSAVHRMSPRPISIKQRLQVTRCESSRTPTRLIVTIVAGLRVQIVTALSNMLPTCVFAVFFVFAMKRI